MVRILKIKKQNLNKLALPSDITKLKIYIYIHIYIYLSSLFLPCRNTPFIACDCKQTIFLSVIVIHFHIRFLCVKGHFIVA